MIFVDHLAIIMYSKYIVITIDDFDSDELTIDSDVIKYMRIDLPIDFEGVINIDCSNLTKLIIVDSDNVKINLNKNKTLEELQCYYSVSDERNDYELYRPMRYIIENYKDLFENNYPIIIQNDCYLSEEEIMNDIDENYYIYENARGWRTNIYDKDTKEFICCI